MDRGEACMGIVVSRFGDKIEVKFLGLPGECGPDLILDLGLAHELNSKLAKVLAE